MNRTPASRRVPRHEAVTGVVPASESRRAARGWTAPWKQTDPSAVPGGRFEQDLNAVFLYWLRRVDLRDRHDHGREGLVVDGAPPHCPNGNESALMISLGYVQ